MLFGLTGASGVGKTTLGKMVADSLDIVFQPTSITECAQKHGFNAVSDLDLGDRMELQKHLLDDHLEMLNGINKPTIMDRTPIDFIGYLMAEFNMHSHKVASDKLLQEAEKYVDDCLKATSARYDFIFTLGKLSLYEVNEKRPAANPAYHRHFDLIIKGALSDLRGETRYAIILGQSLDFRHEFMMNTIAERVGDLYKLRRTSRNIH